jgi:hypothetical protein
VDNDVPMRIAGQRRSSNVGFATLTAILVAAMPKCPLCWLALMSALGVGSVINLAWLQPLAVALLCLSVSMLLVRARRRGGYGPFMLGLVAAGAIYLSKFILNYDPGVYLSGATLISASVWNTLPKRRRATTDTRCHC